MAVIEIFHFNIGGNKMRDKLTKIVQVATLGLALAFTYSHSSDGSFTDSRDGKSYRTVKIGSQTWMAENLNYNASGSKCYENDPANCQIYGRLYNWATALRVCPRGWHLPIDMEWGMLMTTVGGSYVAGTKLKARSGWISYSHLPAGTDDYGFSALPGGVGFSDGDFGLGGAEGQWWIATENGVPLPYSIGMHYRSAEMGGYGSSEGCFLSVRCVKN